MAPAVTVSSDSQVIGVVASSGDFVQHVSTMAASIDRRLRLSLSPPEYAMVQDLVLATRIVTIARNAADDLGEMPAA